MGLLLTAIPRRLLPLVFVSSVLVGVYVFTGFGSQGAVLQHVKPLLGNQEVKIVSADPIPSTTPEPVSRPDAQVQQVKDDKDKESQDTKEQWQDQTQTYFTPPTPGTVKPPGSKYNITMVVPRTKDEDVSWMSEMIPEMPVIFYVADDPSAPYHPPLNKGREVMNYLTYIIDHYDDLPEIIVFMHAHRYTYHNNDILGGGDAVPMIKAINYNRIAREGYVNLRCHWDPGCPAHIHPLDEKPDEYHLEDIVAEAWKVLWPADPIPPVIAQPCCAQFAVTRERIRARPRWSWVAYRDWLLHTKLADYYSGRVWEYAWHFAFTGKPVLCPAEHVCYCDLYGVCFGGEKQYREWDALDKRRREMEAELHALRDAARKALEEQQQTATATDGAGADASETEGPEQTPGPTPDPEREKFLQDKIDATIKELDQGKETAMRRGKDPRMRAAEVGREWKEGDAF